MHIVHQIPGIKDAKEENAFSENEKEQEQEQERREGERKKFEGYTEGMLYVEKLLEPKEEWKKITYIKNAKRMNEWNGEECFKIGWEWKNSNDEQNVLSNNLQKPL